MEALFVTYTMRQILFQIIWWYLQNVHIAYVNKYSGLKYKYKYKYYMSAHHTNDSYIHDNIKLNTKRIAFFRKKTILVGHFSGIMCYAMAAKFTLVAV